MTGSTEHNWTNKEERECLANLVVAASNAEEGKDKPAPDSQIEQVKQVVNEGLIDAFIVYEMGARIHPNAVLYTKDDLRADLVKYVSKYVVVASRP